LRNYGAPKKSDTLHAVQGMAVRKVVSNSGIRPDACVRAANDNDIKNERESWREGERGRYCFFQMTGRRELILDLTNYGQKKFRN
jgi:hypothetical protein